MWIYETRYIICFSTIQHNYSETKQKYQGTHFDKYATFIYVAFEFLLANVTQHAIF